MDITQYTIYNQLYVNNKMLQGLRRVLKKVLFAAGKTKVILLDS